ncbi:FecR family protein [Hylemonella sp. W303a]|uniref:FecR family protein n=1 Tax=Hylemonella sp. W303a TaxID=3389873 RepID=UPI00396AFD96
MTETVSLADPLALIRDRAAEWIVLIEGAGSEQERAAHIEACRAWRGEDARHDQVFRQMQQMWRSVDARPPRRKAMAVMVATVAVTFLAWMTLPTERWLADQYTALGEVRRVALADGSVLTLDSATAVDVRMDARQREIHLHRGRILAQVAKDEAGRPFVVIGRDGTAQALGTRYIVDQRATQTRVQVLESTVAVAIDKKPGQPVVLQAGESIRYTNFELGAREPVSAAAAQAWTHARLVFNEATLSEVVTELSRYRRGVLTVRDSEQLGAMRFTGVLPLDDTDAALRIVAQNLGLKIGQFTPYAVWLEAP